MVAAQARQALYTDKGRVQLELEVGDKVLVHREFLVTPEGRSSPCSKPRPRWYGPLTVIERVAANAFRLDLPGPRTLRCHPVFNVSESFSKRYHQSGIEGRHSEPPLSIGVDLNGYKRYILGEVLDQKTNPRECNT